jgi:hypothetical protein
MRASTQPPAIPTGPFFSFQALPYPLPDVAQTKIKQLGLVLSEAPRDAKKAALKSLDDYTDALRTALGSELCRREFL